MTHDLRGLTFGRLVVLSRAERPPSAKQKRLHWRCLCSCGVEKVVSGKSMLDGRSHSCGCLNLELASSRLIVHRDTGSAEYHAWLGMQARCYRPSHPAFKHYGGRGITVCNRWRCGEGGLHGLECFIADIGRRPSPSHSIDRWPDNDGGYSPDNCRWATRKQQANNRRPPAVEHGRNEKGQYV